MRTRITRALLAAMIAAALMLAGAAPLGQPGPTAASTLITSGK
jgi:hypothetical protein